MSIRRGDVLPVLVGALIVVSAAARIDASDIYVDNLLGSDAFDGIARTPESDTTGPTRSISRALQLANRGDRILIRNTGVPYYESLSIVGSRLSGVATSQFSIVSNGAIVDGSRAVPPVAWQNAGGNLWRIKPWRKGYYQLLLKGKPVPGVVTPRSAQKLPAIPVGGWTAWKGSIYYRSPPLESPLDKPFRFAYRRVGLTLYNARRVNIRGLVFRGFQLDGVNAHDLCEDITLDSVKCEGNARAGIAIAGTSSVRLRNCEVGGNRLHSVLVTELGGVKVVESKLDKPPTLKK